MPGLASFTEIIKTAVMLITKTFKNSIKVKKIRKNANFLFPHITKIPKFY